MDPSGSTGEAAARFLDLVGAWVRRALDEAGDYGPAGHDGGTCLIPWAPYIRATGDARALAFLKRYRDACARAYAGAEWRRGYWRTQEAHHGTEHYELFLYALWRLDPGDDATVAQLLPAARMAMNAEPDVAPWFDEDAGVYRSLHLGADTVGPPAVNVPDHLRFASILLHAYEMTGDASFRIFAARYARRWAGGCAPGRPLPVALGADGPLDALPEADEATYRSFAGAAPQSLAADRPRAENLAASGAPDLFLRLWRITGEDVYRTAARRILSAFADDVAHPIAWQVQGGLRRYRSVTGETGFDDAVRQAADGAARRIGRLSLDPAPAAPPWEDGAVGFRGDIPAWTDEAGRPSPSPLFVYLKGVVESDETIRTRAIDLARVHLRLALAAWPPVAEHGCGARSVHAIARGHGRRNGCGVVTEVLAPALDPAD